MQFSAGVALPGAVVSVITEHLVFSRYDLKTRMQAGRPPEEAAELAQCRGKWMWISYGKLRMDDSLGACPVDRDGTPLLIGDAVRLLEGPRIGSVAEIVGVDNQHDALQVLLEADGNGGLDIALVLSRITRRVPVPAR